MIMNEGQDGSQKALGVLLGDKVARIFDLFNLDVASVHFIHRFSGLVGMPALRATENEHRSHTFPF
jgi:hypothetical protein